jgi:cytochrome c biogenesis protein
MRQKISIFQSIYDGLASIKVTVVLLLVIAVGSLIGTLIPQGLNQQHLIEEYGPRLGVIMDFLRLGDLYHAPWFRVLLLLLCLNLVVCTLHRLPKTIKLVRFRDQNVDPHKLSQFSHYQRMECRLPREELIARLERVLVHDFAPIRRVEARDAYAGVAERGSWSRFAVYLVHSSVLLILVGALMGSMLGFKGMMNVVEGSSAAAVNVSGRSQALPLPFEVRCDRFSVSFYETGAPMEYRSDLSILEGGQVVLQQPIFVNDPLSYKGITFYQASYGATLVSAEVELTERETGTVTKLNLPNREAVALPGTPYEVAVMDFREKLGDMGPAIAIALFQQGHDPTGSWILAKIPGFHGNRVGGFQAKVLDFQQAHYTGLQVKKDPGVWVVWGGFVLLILSIGITFYTSHRKVWVWVSAGNPRQEIHIAAKTNKNSLAFEREFDHLWKRLQNEFRGAQGKTRT